MSIEALVDKIIPKEEIQARLITRFNRFVTLDLTLSDYLASLVGNESKIAPEFEKAAQVTSTLIKRATYTAYTDILDYGDKTLIGHAQGVFSLIDRYRKGEEEKVWLDGSAGQAQEQINHFIAEQIGWDYMAQHPQDYNYG